jgi:hypothetical protein
MIKQDKKVPFEFPRFFEKFPSIFGELLGVEKGEKMLFP